MPSEDSPGFRSPDKVGATNPIGYLHEACLGDLTYRSENEIVSISPNRILGPPISSGGRGTRADLCDNCFS
jgi:hypothetical protein